MIDGEDERKAYARRKRQITRRIRKEVAREFGYRKLPKRGDRLLVSGSQGSGKSREVNRQIGGIHDPDTNVWVLVPTIKKAEEAVAEYQRLALSDGLPAHVMRGRAAPDPERAGKPMCERHKLADRLSAIGENVQERLCHKKGDFCPHYNQCGYQQQRAAFQEGTGGAFYGAHEYAFHPSPAPLPDLVVVDESLILKAATECSFLPNLLRESGQWQKSGLNAALEYRKVAHAVHDALVEHPGREMELMKAAGIDKRRLRAALKYLRDIEEDTTTGIHPSMDDTQIERKIDAAQRSELYKLAVLFRQIRREWDSGRVGFNSIVYRPQAAVEVNGRHERQPRIYVYYLKRTRFGDNVPLLLTDGTGSPPLAKKVFGSDIANERIAVERNAQVTQVRRRTFSRQSITGRSGSGELLPHKAADAERLRGEITKVVHAVPGERKFVSATLQVEECLRRSLPEGSLTGHFGDLRGRNEFEACATGIVIGREQVSAAKLEAITRAFTADDPEPFFSTVDADHPSGFLCHQVRGRRMRDGTVEPEIVMVHPHPPCQEILEQIREAELIQAIDRVRPIFNQRTLYLLTSVVADITVDRSVAWQGLVAGGNRFEQAFARTGRAVALLSAGELARCYDDLWGSPDVAKKDKRRLGLIGDKVQIDYLFGKCPHLIAEYRRPGQRGPACRAAIAGSVPDPRAALVAVVGEVSAFSVVVAPEIAREQQPVAAMRNEEQTELAAGPVTDVRDLKGRGTLWLVVRQPFERGLGALRLPAPEEPAARRRNSSATGIGPSEVLRQVVTWLRRDREKSRASA
jgi:hypothetical protein